MINYPTSLDNFSNPTTSDPLKGGTVPHATQHSDANDAIEALQAKVGVNNSAVTSSHDYKLSEVTGSDKAVGKTATQTLSNKILTAPQINMGSDATGDMYFRNSSGVTSRLPIGATGTILEAQSSGIPAWVPNPSTADASTTVKGVSQEATQAQVLARTATGSTSARLFVNPSTLTTVQTYDYVADAGGTDAYAITVTPAPTAYVTGQVFRFRANTANTGTATLNVNSLGAVTIVKNVSTALDTGDILAGQIIEVVYNGTNFVLQSMVATTSLATTYTSGTTNKNAADASTTQNIPHGLGKIPKYVRLTFQIERSVSPGAIIQSTAVYNGTTQSSVSTYLTGSFGIVSSNTNLILNADLTSGTQTGVVTFDATNIIITWTKTNSPGGNYQLLWEAQA